MSGSIGGLSPIASYLAIEKNELAAATKAEKGNASTQQSLAHFSSSATTMTSAAQLLSDYKSLTVVLGAYGMSSMIGETAIIKDLLTQTPTSKTSLAATSGNATWIKFAQAMSGWSSGSTPFSNPSSVASISNLYVENQFETQEGSTSPALQDAFYFTRTIASDGSSLNSLMSDTKQLGVVEEVLGLDPTVFGGVDYSQQVRILTNQLKWSSFSSASSIQRYAEQYLVEAQLDPPSTASSFTVANLFGTGSSSDSLLDIIGASLSLVA